MMLVEVVPQKQAFELHDHEMAFGCFTLACYVCDICEYSVE